MLLLMLNGLPGFLLCHLRLLDRFSQYGFLLNWRFFFWRLLCFRLGKHCLRWRRFISLKLGLGFRCLSGFSRSLCRLFCGLFRRSSCCLFSFFLCGVCCFELLSLCRFANLVLIFEFSRFSLAWLFTLAASTFLACFQLFLGLMLRIKLSVGLSFPLRIKNILAITPRYIAGVAFENAHVNVVPVEDSILV